MKMTEAIQGCKKILKFNYPRMSSFSKLFNVKTIDVVLPCCKSYIVSRITSTSYILYLKLWFPASNVNCRSDWVPNFKQDMTNCDVCGFPKAFISLLLFLFFAKYTIYPPKSKPIWVPKKGPCTLFLCSADVWTKPTQSGYIWLHSCTITLRYITFLFSVGVLCVCGNV